MKVLLYEQTQNGIYRAIKNEKRFLIINKYFIDLWIDEYNSDFRAEWIILKEFLSIYKITHQ